MEQPVPTIDRVQQLEEALQQCQALALAGQFAAATVHEVNGPLEAITNLNYLVKTSSDDGEQVRHYSDLIDEQLLVLSLISRQTLSFYHSKETVEATDCACSGSGAPHSSPENRCETNSPAEEAFGRLDSREPSGSDASGLFEPDRQRCGGATD